MSQIVIGRGPVWSLIWDLIDDDKEQMISDGRRNRLVWTKDPNGLSICRERETVGYEQLDTLDMFSFVKTMEKGYNNDKGHNAR